MLYVLTPNSTISPKYDGTQDVLKHAACLSFHVHSTIPPSTVDELFDIQAWQHDKLPPL